MANYKSEVMKLVARCRQLGWEVKIARERGNDWSHAIICPDGHKLLLHKTPSDPDVAMEIYYRELGRHGFYEALAAYQDGEERRRLATIAEDRARNEARLREAEIRAKQQEKQQALLAKAAGPYTPQPVNVEWLTTPAEWPDTRTVIMTPEAAKVVMDTMNTQNRRPSPSRIAYFEGLIIDGGFGTTHQGVAIDTKGVLQDGQSRLQAIINTNEPVAIQVSVGMDPENFAKVDTGSNRSGRDTAYIMGEANPAEMAATTKMLISVSEFGPDAHVQSRRFRLSNERLEHNLRQFGNPLREAVARAKEIKKDLRHANASGLACGIYLITQRLPKKDPRVQRFMEDLQYGEVPRGGVMWKLRQALLNGASGRYYNAWETAALLIKAWNFLNTGKKVTVLAWRAGSEPFPAHVFLPPPPEKDEA
jgi:hypothetical protein